MSAGNITVITLPPIGGSAAGGVVLSPDGGRAFQTSHRKSGGSGPDQTWVSVINPDNTVATVVASEGSPDGGVVISPDGSRVFQTSHRKSGGSGPDQTWVSVINPDNTVITLPPIEGRPCGSVVVSPDGSRAYQTTVAKGVLVSVIGSDNTVTTLPPIPGEPPAGGPLGGGAVVVSPDGARAFQSTQRQVSGKWETLVSVIGSDNTVATLPPIPGYAAWRVAVRADSARAYQTTGIINPFSSGPAETLVSVIDRDNTVTTLPSIDNTPWGGVMVSPDGSRAYQTTGPRPDLFPPLARAWVSVIDPDNTVTTLGPLDGLPWGPGVVVTPDGNRVYQGTVTFPDADSSRAWMSLINPENTGEPQPRPQDISQGQSWLLVINPDNTVTTLPPIDGFAWLPDPVVVSPKGSRAYHTALTATQTGQAWAYHTWVSVINPDNTVTTLPPIDGLPPSRVVVSGDGSHAYQVTQNRDSSQSSPTEPQTFVSVITSDNTVITSPAIPGEPEGALAVSHDGSRAYQTTHSGIPTYETSVSVIQLTAEAPANQTLLTALLNANPQAAVAK